MPTSFAIFRLLIRVRILVADAGGQRALSGGYANRPEQISLRCNFFHVPTNRGWIRDFGPIFVRNAEGAQQ